MTEGRGPGRPTKAEETKKMATTVATEVAKALKREERETTGFYKTSRQPFESDTELTPETFDIRKEAERLAAEKGHTLSKWEAVEYDSHLSGPAPIEDWRATSLQNGLGVHARWMPPPQNNPKAKPFPAIGGMALKIDARAPKAAKAAKRSVRAYRQPA